MKALTVLSLILVSPAFARAMECTDLARPQGGYTITVNEAKTEAVVYSNIKSPRELLATLQCNNPQFQKPASQSEIYVSYICSEPQSSDRGHAVYLMETVAGYQGAVLAEVSGAVAAKIAEFTCE